MEVTPIGQFLSVLLSKSPHMAFYDLSKYERTAAVKSIRNTIFDEAARPPFKKTTAYFEDEDTYIRKSAYLAAGRIYTAHENLRGKIIAMLNELLTRKDHKIRQTVINAAGEIGKKDFPTVQHIFDKGLFDAHHSPRNAVIERFRKM